MNRGPHFDISAMVVVAWTRALAALAVPVEAIACCRAAQRDERKGYQFAAAMEWRKAAQHLAAIPTASGFCWKQWERIMHLPRRFANPIVDDTMPQFVPQHRVEQATLRELPAIQIPLASVA
jgi:hypothetical protein